MSITIIYAALLGLIFAALSLNTIKRRRAAKVTLGVSDDKPLLRATRVHGNFQEYTPFALLLIYMLENEGTNVVVIHLLCLALLSGRLIHLWGVSHEKENFRFRVVGMMLTIGTIISASLRLLLVPIL